MKLFRTIGICTIMIAMLMTVGSVLDGLLRLPEPDSTFTYIAGPGDTLDGIADDYYGLQNSKVISIEEYALQIRVLNKDLHNHRRQLQIGDEVIVPMFNMR